MNDDERILEFPILYLDVLNKNKRIYRKDDIDIKALNSRLKEVTTFGQLGFPEDYETSLALVSHVMLEYKFGDNNELIAKIRLLNTPNGKIVKKILDIDSRSLVLRTRAIGHVDNINIVHIHKLITCDFIPIEEDSFDNEFNRVTDDKPFEKI